MPKIDRRAITALFLSATALVTLVMSEGYSDHAVIPVKGDRYTYGFGSTWRPDGASVKKDDSITPPLALGLALREAQKYESAIKECITVPLYQYEYESFVSLSYNIGPTAFCTSTLARKLNSGDYKGACNEISRWINVKGRKVQGLVNRRERESKQCLGE